MVLVYIHTLFLHAAHTTVFTRHTRSLLAVSKLPVENEKSTETFPLASASIPAPSHAIFAHVHAVHAVASLRPPGGKAQRRPPVNGLHSGSLGGINCENNRMGGCAPFVLWSQVGAVSLGCTGQLAHPGNRQQTAGQSLPRRRSQLVLLVLHFRRRRSQVHGCF